MKTPPEIYRPSAAVYAGLPELTNALHDRDVLVTACGRICMYRKKVNGLDRLGGSEAGHQGGRPGAENPATLGQPVRREVVTHVLGTVWYLCLRSRPTGVGVRSFANGRNRPLSRR